ncbi:hypothetical protein MMC12_003917 [Toensbergia leucococca]|nr:hypothetical protein [Toensbergia leucococca]
MSPPSPPPTLQATYTSPKTSKQFHHPLPTTLPTTSTPEKTLYLSQLRTSVTQLQEEVNSFLTAKMEEDKALVAADTDGGAGVDDKKEEERYGEEGDEGEG